jgi:membrane-associated phospholipid phosphatase
VSSKAERQITLAGILPQPDRRSFLAYAILAVLIPSTYLAIYLSGVHLATDFITEIQLFALIPIFIAWMFRRAGHTNIATAIETGILMFIKGGFILVLQYAVITIPAPYADDFLLAVDRALGFNWLTFARLFTDPAVFETIKFAYLSMSKQAAMLLLLLAITGHQTRAWQLLTASIIALVATILIFPFFPADGRYMLCGLKAPDVPLVQGFCDYGPIIHLIKDQGVRAIEKHMLVGMVSLPSFHASAALLLVWGVWGFKWLRAPMVVLNVLMLIGTIVIGQHYLIDIIGGLALGAAAIWISIKYVRPQPVRQSQDVGIESPAPA